MPLPPAFLEELRTRLPLSELIARAVPVQRAGREHKACCPFHNEKTPSFTINDQKGFFHCFGCGAHGDVIGFAMRYHRLSFPEAVESLAAEAGLEVPRLSREEAARADTAKSLHQLCEAACLWYEAQLRKSWGHAALDYLQSRALTEETIARFRLGYAPADGNALLTHLKEQGFDEAQMLEAGLARKNDAGRLYSFFRDRVIFPVSDRRGRVVAFGARLLHGDGPKYINSPDHPLFHKGQLLYSLSRAREAAPNGQPVIVAEGYMDVIRLHEAGFTAGVAPLGTALTEDQMMEVWRLGNAGGDPILCFDGDNAGQRAAERSVMRLLPHLGPDRTARIAFMPTGEDPDSLIRTQGPKAMQAVLDQAIGFFDMLWRLESTGRDLAAPEARAGIEKAMEEKIALIQDAKAQGHYRRVLKDKLYDAFRWKAQEKSKFKPKVAPYAQARQLPAPAAMVRQRQILAAFLGHPAIFATLGEWLSGHSFAAELDKLRQDIVHTLETEPELTHIELRQRMVVRENSALLDLLLSPATYRLAPWARPTAEIGEALRGLQGVMATANLAEISAEMPLAGWHYGLNTDEAGQARVTATRHEIEGARAATMPDEPDTTE